MKNGVFWDVMPCGSCKRVRFLQGPHNITSQKTPFFIFLIVLQVLNAIDAGATSIAVRVHFKFHKIQVIDNGYGLNSTHLDLIGTR
jgi:hypothetical protein